MDFTSIFERMETCRNELEKDEAQALVEEIINIMRTKNITYACAFRILERTEQTLTVLSKQLPL